MSVAFLLVVVFIVSSGFRISAILCMCVCVERDRSLFQKNFFLHHRTFLVLYVLAHTHTHRPKSNPGIPTATKICAHLPCIWMKIRWKKPTHTHAQQYVRGGSTQVEHAMQLKTEKLCPIIKKFYRGPNKSLLLLKEKHSKKWRREYKRFLTFIIRHIFLWFVLFFVLVGFWPFIQGISAWKTKIFKPTSSHGFSTYKNGNVIGDARRKINEIKMLQ